MAENKTKPTVIPVADFLSAASAQRQEEALQLITVMRQISGLEPVMWGPTIIGFGTQHYKSDAGREGDMPRLAFSPRKAALTVYFYDGFEHYGAELARLGKHKFSSSCLYINKLADIDLAVLTDMLKKSFGRTQKYTTVQEYIDQIPAAARPSFDQLRALVQKELSQAEEVLSYGIISYKIDQKRARVFISGWKDHLGVYPIPKEEKLREQLNPFIKGKGTLWFPLDQPLPTELLRKVVRALAA
ncbi:MAG TPA: DUF1801 domain-containing protein [Candidatus Saccharibacteria bacterium]|nr:DUF1801 domain-containing protein [Candidatus Saccharibacteria bacterium]